MAAASVCSFVLRLVTHVLALAILAGCAYAPPDGAACTGVSSEVCEQAVDESMELVRMFGAGPLPHVATIVIRAVPATCIDEHVTPLAEAVVALVERPNDDPLRFIVVEAANGEIIRSVVLCQRES
jgi:hypothetical protein